MREMIPRDESDENSAVLELRAGSVLHFMLARIGFQT